MVKKECCFDSYKMGRLVWKMCITPPIYQKIPKSIAFSALSDFLGGCVYNKAFASPSIYLFGCVQRA